MTPAFGLILIGGILLVAGFQGRNVIDVALGREGKIPDSSPDDSATPAVTNDGGSGPSVPPATGGKQIRVSAGLGTFDGHPVAAWIIPILTWARHHGWTGTVNSGYRTPAEQMTAATNYGLGHYGPAGPLGSNHVKKYYPGGAVDVSQPEQLAGVLAHYPGHPTLVWGGPVMGDTVHFSHDGH